jgi:prepilin-type processing-associated H-X9-DG protein
MSSNEWEQARAYVEQLREEGRTDEEIRQVMLKSGWTEEQVEKLFAREVLRAPPPPPPAAQPSARTGATAPPASVPTPGRSPRQPARAADISQGAKVGIILVSVFAPIAGLIWGLIYLFSGQVAKKRWGAWGLGISVFVGLVHAGLVFSLVAPMGAFGHARGQARQAVCLSNMKQLSLGALMYCQDYNERMPDAANWQEQLDPYVKNRQIYDCPSGGTYAMNSELSWKTLSEISRPHETVLFYEVDNSGNPLYDVHMGKANYAYVDGHAASREKSEEGPRPTAQGTRPTRQRPRPTVEGPTAAGKTISHGEEVNLEDHVVAGKITIFDFYSDYCPPCGRISPKLEELAGRRDDIAVLKVDINRPGKRGIDWQSPVARQFSLRSIPHFIIYDANGRVMAEGREAYGRVREWLGE